MIDVEKRLEQFVAQHSLWQLALEGGRKLLANHFVDEPKECATYFPDQRAGDVRFVPKMQHLTFNYHSSPVFIISTFYSLFSSTDKEQSKEVGYYAFDVDANGKVIDDWLVFH